MWFTIICLESKNLPRRPPLEIARAHAQELVGLMSRSGLGSCAFANLDELLSIPWPWCWRSTPEPTAGGDLLDTLVSTSPSASSEELEEL